jgi:hypothetical protein
MTELNVTRDVLTFHYLLMSTKEKQDIQYDMFISEWSEKGIKLMVNFTDPN